MNTKSILVASLAMSSLAFSYFNDCKFNFGRQWSNSFSESTNFSGQGLTHLAIWLGDNANYNQFWEGAMVRAAKANSLTPVIYAYVIAEVGKDNGLGDCDVSGTNHCNGGANIVRNKWSEILNRYGSYAAGIAGDFGTSNPTIWLIEPDFLQYSVTGDNLNTKYAQAGGGIPDKDLAGTYFNQIVAKIKQSLPNAKIAVDISPWMNTGITAWYGNFDKSKVDYLFTSGGRTQGNNTRIRSDNNNNVTWTMASQAMGGKKIIADDGYGVGGGSNSDYAEWMSTSNISARVSEGVIGITIQEPTSSFTQFAAQNSNISTGCGTTPSSAVLVSSSAVAPSSSRPASSATAPSSSRPSSSSAYVPPQSSSSQYVPTQSSSVVTPPPSSSSSVISDGSWNAKNAQLNSPSNTGVAIGVGDNWNDPRVVSKVIGSVTAGTSYTLKFNTEISRGGQTMSVDMALGSNCTQKISIASADAPTPQTCQFTASSTGLVTLSLTLPESRWETVTISNLSLTDASGQQVKVLAGRADLRFSAAQIKLHSGKPLTWLVPVNAVLDVYSVTGKKALSNQGSFIDASSLPLGIYIIRARANGITVTKKIQNF